MNLHAGVLRRAGNTIFPAAAGGAPGSLNRLIKPGHQDEERPAHVLAAVAEVLVLDAVEVVDHEVALGMIGMAAKPGEDRLPDPRLVAVPVVRARPDDCSHVEPGLP